MHRGPHVVVKLGLAMLAGAVVTWVVAWGCALWAMPGGFPEFVVRRGDEAVALGSGAGMGVSGDFVACRLDSTVFNGFGVRIGLNTLVQSDDIDLRYSRRTKWDSWVETRAGWPMGALHGREVLLNGRMTLRYEQCVGAPKLLRPSAIVLGAKRVLPLGVLAWGFLVNTVLGACVVLVVWEVMAVARRRWLVRGGRCSGCGYDRRGLVVGGTCPECGVAG